MLGELTNAAVVVAAAFEVVGVSVIVGGFIWSLVRGIAARGKVGPESPYVVVRNIFARSVLLGLEVLVAADLVRTIDRGRAGHDAHVDPGRASGRVRRGPLAYFTTTY